MPLSKPTIKRELFHTRQVTCQGYLREDGLWDIEAYLLDTKTHSFPIKLREAPLPPGQALHEMRLRLTLDEQFKIHAVEAVMEATPFYLCPNITEQYQKLNGLIIGPGWNMKIKELLGGAQGCTHLTELLGPLATTAFQTIYGATGRKRAQQQTQNPTQKPKLLNTCHNFASDSEVVQKIWPQFYTGKITKPETSDISD